MRGIPCYERETWVCFNLKALEFIEDFLFLCLYSALLAVKRIDRDGLAFIDLALELLIATV